MIARTIGRRCEHAFLALLIAWVPLPTTPASASPLLEFVGDAGSPAALQARTLSGGAGAAYFNPALLCGAREGVTVGFFVLAQRIALSFDGRPGSQFDVPDGIENARTAEGEQLPGYPIATRLLEEGRVETANRSAFNARPRQGAGSGNATVTYVVPGIVLKLLGDRLTLGLHGMLPNRQFTRLTAFFNDEREQYFSNSLHPELYGERILALSFAVGAGIELTDSLWIGLGWTFTLRTATNAKAFVADPGDLGNLLLDIDSPVETGIAPHFGLRYGIGERLQLAASAHSPQQVELGAGFSFLLPNAIESASSLSFVLDYLPWRFSLGAAYDLVKAPDQTLTLAGTALYADWSSYRDRHGNTPAAPYDWTDTISPTVGIHYRLDALTTALDVTYSPTPVPDQTGRTNYVDNDRIGGTLATEYDFEAFGLNWQVGARFEAHSLVSRYQRKLPTPTLPDGENAAPALVWDELPDDAEVGGRPVLEAPGLQTNNPGWPGFESSGWLLGAGMNLSVVL